MSLGSLLAANEPSHTPGSDAVVGVAVATLWTAPDRVRPVDEPALWVPARPREWVEQMSPADRADLPGRTETQLLLGERVQIVELRDGWAHIVAYAQPSAKDPRGYPGWLPMEQLFNVDGLHAGGVRISARHRDAAGSEDRTGVWHVVVATATALRDDPDGGLAVPGVTFGTRLMALGAADDGWLPVAVPGRFEPAWAIEEDIAAVPSAPPADHADALAWADRMRDVPYVWGGTCAYGVDCSGLVHLIWRRFGVVLARDAADQVTQTDPIPLGEERPGDLYFFGDPGQPIDHVAFVASEPGDGTQEILHAAAGNGRVCLEPLRDELRQRLVAIGRVRA